MTGVMAAVGRWRKRPLGTAMIKGKNFSSGSWTSLNLLMFGKRTWIWKVIHCSVTHQQLVSICVLPFCFTICSTYCSRKFRLHQNRWMLTPRNSGRDDRPAPIGAKSEHKAGWWACREYITAPYFVGVDTSLWSICIRKECLSESCLSTISMWHDYIHPVDLYGSIIIETFSGVDHGCVFGDKVSSWTAKTNSLLDTLNEKTLYLSWRLSGVWDHDRKNSMSCTSLK